jgi:hypothetical protein
LIGNIAVCTVCECMHGTRDGFEPENYKHRLL